MPYVVAAVERRDALARCGCEAAMMRAETTPTLKLYDSLTKQAGVVEPRTPGELGVYICGPTVYNYVHIGNARPYWVGQVLQRFVTRRLGWHVRLVVNITDVDDKIYRAPARRASARASSPRATPQAYIDDTDRLGLGRPDVEPLRDRDDGADHRADRGARASAGSRTPPAATCTSGSRPSPATASSRASASRISSPARASSRARPRSRRPTSRCGRARSPTRTSPGPRPGARAAGLAHRVLGDGARAPRRRLRRARRRARPRLPAPRERAGPERGRRRAPVRAALAAQRDAAPRATRRCRSRSATSSGCATRSIASGARRCSPSSRAPATGCRSTTTSATLEQAAAVAERFRETLRNARRYARSAAAGADAGIATVGSDAAAAFDAALADDLDTPAALAVLHGLAGELNARGRRRRRRPAAPSAARPTSLRDALWVLGLRHARSRRGRGSRRLPRSSRWPRSASEARAARDFARSDELRDEIARRGYIVRDTPQGFELVPLDAAT